MLNKVQIIYRLEDRVILAWPLRPNADSDTSPESYNVYFSSTVAGSYTKIGSVDNASGPTRSYHGKVSFTLIPGKIPGWDTSKANFIRIAPVISGVEQAQEDPVSVPPYSVAGMRLTRESLQRSIAVGYNKDEDRFIPLNVDQDGKLKTAV